jgi:poly(3-hydroxybutyrate) depolymerase
MPLRRRGIAAGIAALCCGADAAVTCSATRPLAALERVKVNIVSQGLSRYFWLTLPAANATVDVPLMLVFHGGASTALDFLDGGAFLVLKT